MVSYLKLIEINCMLSLCECEILPQYTDRRAQPVYLHFIAAIMSHRNKNIFRIACSIGVILVAVAVIVLANKKVNS